MKKLIKLITCLPLCIRESIIYIQLINRVRNASPFSMSYFEKNEYLTMLNDPDFREDYFSYLFQDIR